MKSNGMDDISFNSNEIRTILKGIKNEIKQKKDNEIQAKYTFDQLQKTKIYNLILEENGTLNYKRDCSAYTQIYALGDLHADYASFFKRLEDLGIIEAPKNNFWLKQPIKIDINTTAELEDLIKLASDFKWIAKEGTLLVICGDIVDGRRDFNDVFWNNEKIKHEVDDHNGVFEILLHIFLKNLKFQASKKGSDVICIYGNHDLSLFFPLPEYKVGNVNMKFTLPSKYIHTSSYEFFNRSSRTRARWLTPFYKNNFYFLFELTNKDIPEIQFVHGALHTENKNHSRTPVSIYENTIKFQKNTHDRWKTHWETKYKFKETEEQVSDLEKLWLLDGVRDHKTNKTVVWDRIYSGMEENDNMCDFTDGDKITTIRNGPTIISGHCQNSRQNYVHKEIIGTRPCMKKEGNIEIREGKGSRNCIYPKCYNKNGIPKIVMVDNEMSSCFNHSRDADGGMRQVEILLISKNETIQSESEQPMPYFDKYETIYYDKATNKTTTFLLNKPFTATEKGGNHSRKRRSKQRKKHKKTPKRRKKSM